VQEYQSTSTKGSQEQRVDIFTTEETKRFYLKNWESRGSDGIPEEKKCDHNNLDEQTKNTSYI